MTENCNLCEKPSYGQFFCSTACLIKKNINAALARKKNLEKEIKDIEFYMENCKKTIELFERNGRNNDT